MNLPSLLYPRPEPHVLGSIGLLLVRLATGLMLVPHGYAKISGDVVLLAAGLASKGFPAPTLLAWCATLAELLGGLFVALGLLTRPAAAVVAFNMVVAWASMHLGDIAKIGGPGGSAFEYPFLLSMTALAIAIAGPGRYSLDAVLFGPKTAPGGVAGSGSGEG
jgi:putative oxidoreductase